MRTTLIAAILALLVACPAGVHGFGILRYTWDFIKNQVGVDRGPHPKVLREKPPLHPGHMFHKAHIRKKPACKAEGY
jgi:hypothetical protein